MLSLGGLGDGWSKG